MDEARKAAQFLVDAYASRRPTGDTEPYALIVARALLAITPEVTHETMPGAERAQRTSEHIPTPEGRGGERNAALEEAKDVLRLYQEYKAARPAGAKAEAWDRGSRNREHTQPTYCN